MMVDTMSTSSPGSSLLRLLSSSPDLSLGIASLHTLVDLLSSTRVDTLQELFHVLRNASNSMKVSVADKPYSSICIDSTAQLFLRFITLASEALEEQEELEKVRDIMVTRGQRFLQHHQMARDKVAKASLPFLRNGCRLLIHSYSRCVLSSLRLATSNYGRELHAFVTQCASIEEEKTSSSNPIDEKNGQRMIRELSELGVDAKLVLDSAVGHIMSSIDCVLMGAEGVVESGGVVNKIGSYTIALCAKALNKPVYVLTESFKFVRLFPLNQQDLPNKHTYWPSGGDQFGHPQVDYTPPSLITLLFTDLGVLTPSAVSDELIKLYN